jgi:hypothetical protein
MRCRTIKPEDQRLLEITYLGRETFADTKNSSGF